MTNIRKWEIWNSPFVMHRQRSGEEKAWMVFSWVMITALAFIVIGLPIDAIIGSMGQEVPDSEAFVSTGIFSFILGLYFLFGNKVYWLHGVRGLNGYDSNTPGNVLRAWDKLPGEVKAELPSFKELKSILSVATNRECYEMLAHFRQLESLHARKEAAFVIPDNRPKELIRSLEENANRLQGEVKIYEEYRLDPKMYE